ncbi:Serine/threonine-protein phosphatase 2A activator 2 [Mycoemilia scoparia]|uniref:Serine/threonine-protein phosphatase 2A activator n=1 Tax=Mycoemilia scoparia TaxID=417184 RepID=A0A9W8DWN6_9FUNG|nr:Serine/threonine-protein phosphatase 2A activator 2 [Mycoemilia scoparia]
MASTDNGSNDIQNTFAIPKKEILTKEDLDKFSTSPAFEEIIGFIRDLSSSVEGQKLGDADDTSPAIEKLSALLKSLSKCTDDILPFETKSRFGNPSFRKWYDTVKENIPTWLDGLVESDAIPEVSKYLVDSFGSRQRIDYGTGHELNFLAFLLCLKKLNVVDKSNYKSLVLKIFFGYIEVMRGLQTTYWLEPAGSHGVWGLDDFHFLPFLFGAAQLKGHKFFRPKSIHNKEILEEYSKDYMYFNSVHFVCNQKTESLRWHSPMLDDISGAKTWEKVNNGLIKMYQAEVLGKLPIMQHFIFGSLILFKGSMPKALADSEDGGHGDDREHEHVYAFGQEFPQCCGIKIPSGIAAASASGQGSISSRPRPLPFD